MNNQCHGDYDEYPNHCPDCGWYLDGCDGAVGWFETDEGDWEEYP